MIVTKRDMEFNDLQSLGLKSEQIIILSKSGAHMYGTDTPESDLDFLGVFLPTREQLLMNKVPSYAKLPTESGYDILLWSIYHFMELACQGETMAVDLLHSPYPCWQMYNPGIWDQLRTARHMFYTKNMTAFVSYARKEATKYGVKGERLNELKNVMECLKSFDGNLRLKNIWDELPEGKYVHFFNDDKPVRTYEVCGRKYQETVKVSYAISRLTLLLTDYGKRAKIAAENDGIEWKSLSHAYRVVEQLYCILKQGEYEYPLPNNAFIKGIKLGKFDFNSVVQPALADSIDDVEKLMAESNLPETVDKQYWDKWLIETIEGFVL